jgi:hypothetical protein
MLKLTGGNRTVPVIFEEGKPVQVGWRGQGCFVYKASCISLSDDLLASQVSEHPQPE